MSWVALYPRRAGRWERMLALAQQSLLRTVLTTEVKKAPSSERMAHGQ